MIGLLGVLTLQSQEITIDLFIELCWRKLFICWPWPLQCYLCVVQEVVDAVLAIKKEGEPIDLHMVEVMEMQHKTDMDTVYTPSLYHFMLHSYASEWGATYP